MSLKSSVRNVLAPILSRLDARAAHQAQIIVDAAPPVVKDDIPIQAARSSQRVFVPMVENVTTDAETPFMQFATCSTADMVHPRFAELMSLIGIAPSFHRKQWEFGYILHHLLQRNVITPGARGLGFGVGLEVLPAAFANMGSYVVASDAPPEVNEGAGWRETDQHSLSIEDLPNPGICEVRDFQQRVSYRSVDMNNINADLTGFDFCWSACCFEHLGSIQHGLEFVKNSVERCLAPGGIAVHTTELNLSSNHDTVESPHLSIFRRSDLQSLIDGLRASGHTVSDLIIAPDSHYLDQYVDVPPYSNDLHLKLELAGFVTTSVGLVIQKKR